MLEVVLLLGAMALFGCASGPAFVAPEPPRANEAIVYVYRESHLMGLGITHAASVDGRAVGTLVNGSYLQVGVPTSDQFVELRLAGCGRLNQPLLLRPGQTHYVQAALTHKTVMLGGKAYFDHGCVLAERTPAEALLAIRGLPRAAMTALAASTHASASDPPAFDRALAPTNFEAVRAQALTQDRGDEAAAYLQRLQHFQLWRDSGGALRAIILPHEKAILECVTAMIPTPSPVQLAFRVAKDGTVVDAYTDQPGFISECTARKTVGLHLPAPPLHGFALCHRYEKDGERSTTTPCSGIGWTDRCEQIGTTRRCRSEFKRPG